MVNMFSFTRSYIFDDTSCRPGETFLLSILAGAGSIQAGSRGPQRSIFVPPSLWSQSPHIYGIESDYIPYIYIYECINIWSHICIYKYIYVYINILYNAITFGYISIWQPALRVSTILRCSTVQNASVTGLIHGLSGSKIWRKMMKGWMWINVHQWWSMYTTFWPSTGRSSSPGTRRGPQPFPLYSLAENERRRDDISIAVLHSSVVKSKQITAIHSNHWNHVRFAKWWASAWVGASRAGNPCGSGEAL